MQIDKVRVRKAKKVVKGISSKISSTVKSGYSKLEEYESKAAERREAEIKSLKHQIIKEKLKKQLSKLKEKNKSKGDEFIW